MPPTMPGLPPGEGANPLAWSMPTTSPALDAWLGLAKDARWVVMASGFDGTPTIGEARWRIDFPTDWPSAVGMPLLFSAVVHLPDVWMGDYFRQLHAPRVVFIPLEIWPEERLWELRIPVGPGFPDELYRPEHHQWIIPEPPVVMLCGIGGLGLAWIRRTRP